jgi:hypothetical protein
MNALSSTLLRWLRRSLVDGTIAAVASGSALAVAGQRQYGRSPSAINALSHVVWGDRALRRNEMSLRYTGAGAAIHQANAWLWAGLYEALRIARRRHTPLNAVVDAAAVTAVAAAVDLKLRPQRLAPGFERRLTPQRTFWVYATLGAGLALGGLLGMRHR